MPLGQVAKCWKCGAFRSGDELVLNKSNWEYQCEDDFVCRERAENPPKPKVRKKAPKAEKKRSTWTDNLVRTA